MQVKYYDIGLNLFCRQFPEPENVIQGAKDNGVCCILTGTDPKENQKIDDFVKTHDAYGTVGIHPHNADRAKQEDFRQIEQILAENPRVVAVGECGLDYDRMFSTKENQIRCLENHIVLAEKWEKPLFLHERDAAEDFELKIQIGAVEFAEIAGLEILLILLSTGVSSITVFRLQPKDILSKMS